MPHQPQLLPDQPSHEQAARDAERSEYLERLREKLKDPKFRAIEGFPIGEDEDILALSDPPYYTACPNPFLPEIIERWQAERAQVREAMGLPDDREEYRDGTEPFYHREPFAADVSEGKSDAIYRAHSYHTKVPHKAIMRYILHYTDPGDIVFDAFCGTGMIGVAAQLCGDKKTVESLGYSVKTDGAILDEQGRPLSHLAARRSVLVDLSPLATFIAYNYNTPMDVTAFEREATRILQEITDECGWMYRTTHKDGRTSARISYTVWSEILLCPECTGEVVFLDEALDRKTKKTRSSFPCPHCGVNLKKRQLERYHITDFDTILGTSVKVPKRCPVRIQYKIGGTTFEKPVDKDDLALLERIEALPLPDGLLTDELPFMHMTHQRANMANHGVTHIHHFFLPRPRHALVALWKKANAVTDPRLRSNLLFTFEQAIWGMSLLARYAPTHYSQVNQYLTGVFYIGSQIAEVSPWYILDGKVKRLVKAFGDFEQRHKCSAISTQSAEAVTIPDDSIDYIFTDPPFGENIYYADLNFLVESWHRVLTNSQPEAIIDKAKQKRLADYQELMRLAFLNCYRVLKPGRWMTVEFHNSHNSVWNAIQEAMLRAGFVVADVRTLDKQQSSYRQLTASSAAKQDLVISAYKARTGFEHHFLEQAGSAKGVWDFVRQHLEQLPIIVEQDGVLEVVAERQAFLLYDRMVAFHIQRGFSVPMGAAEFYAGLKQRFPERDGMYFLPHQVAEYDRQRLQASKVEQLSLFLTDEKSAIQWLRQELDPATGSGPQTYQDIQPKFLRELHKARHENLPELSEMLAQNFLKDDRDRWYLPDPARQGDLEQLRERSLLREFQEYAGGKGRLRVFRTEAVRAGFKHAWHERDYKLIVQVAERLPESVLQEDAGLLMYYDNAVMRAEEEPIQRSFDL